MVINTIIEKLSANLSSYDITLYPAASEQELADFEQKLNCSLPNDIRALYLFCNGFESAEDLFRIIPLDEIGRDRLGSNPNRFGFAEYMIYCDLWEVDINPLNPADYWIVNDGQQFRKLTKSMAEFLDRFLANGVFGEKGLYVWHEEVDKQNRV